MSKPFPSEVLTPKQQIVFDEIKNTRFVTESFYFTGGTALSAVYLHHRLSEDLDFFSESKLDTFAILNLVTQLSKKLGCKIESQEMEVVRIYNLEFKDKEKLKIDFGYYPYKRLKGGKLIDTLEVDSLLDIAVNKLQTIHQRSDIKDFVGLYFLLREFTVWDLMEGVKAKFRMELDPYAVAVDCLKVERFENLPKMLVPLGLAEIQDFFKDLARKLGKEAVKE